MNIETYSDLEREIQRYQNEIEHLNDVQRQLNESNLGFEERNREQQSITNHMNNTNQILNNLLEMQRAYNNIIHNIKELQKIDLENVSNEEEAQIEINARQNEIIEDRKILPESLQREIRENIVANQFNTNNDVSRNTTVVTENTPDDSTLETQNDVDYKNEYENLINEYNQILSDRDLDEIGLNDFDEIEKKYDEVSAKRDKLFEAINDLEDKISEEELNDLLSIDNGLKEKLDRDIDEFNIIKETKVAFKEEIEKEIKDIEDGIVSIAEEQKEEKLKKLYGELDTILNGGKIEMTLSVDEVIKQVKPQGPIPAQTVTQKPIQTEIQKPVQSQSQGPAQTQSSPTQTGTQKPAQAQTQEPAQAVPLGPNTLDGLVKSGVLPRNLSREELVDLCSKLNIKITDESNVLSKEQVERLANDHEIQVALLNQKMVDRNHRKIAEYDKLIAKYESILKDKMEGKQFSKEYISKVETLLRKSKDERQKYVDRNERIKEYGQSEMLGVISGLRESGLDSKATGINDKLRNQYKKLDDLREKRESSKSKFKQRIEDSRIKKTLDKIDKLKSKKGVIADKQTQIVNENSSKYISKVTKKIQKHLTKQGKVEISVDKINDLSERIEKNNQERQNIALDRQKETRLLDRIGLAFEDRKLQAQTASLEGQRNMEDIVGRLR